MMVGKLLSYWKSFSFIDFLDQAVCDLIGDGADGRKDQRVLTAAAPARFRADLTAINEILARWSDEQIARLGCSTAGTTLKKKKHKVTNPEELAYRANLLQIVCYFRSTYEVLIDADERLSELLSPADLLTHLRVLVHLPSSQLVPILKYLVCWPIAKWLRQEMPEVPEGIPPEIFGSPLNLFSNGRLGPRRHLKNLISSRTNNRRALRVTWCWLQGAKRGLPEIPPEFILASKLKHAKALQKQLPKIEDEYLADFQRELKVLWRGVHSTRERHFRDEDGIIRSGLVRQWKANKPVRPWEGNPGWNACTEKSRSNGGKTEAVRESIRAKLEDRLNAYVADMPDSRSKSILPRVHACDCIVGRGRDPRSYAEC